MNLKGIGEKKAKTIIEFRENNGPFKQPEDLIKVPGIGPKTLEANKNRIAVK
jgi:competence protein ComEA